MADEVNELEVDDLSDWEVADLERTLQRLRDATREEDDHLPDMAEVVTEGMSFFRLLCDGPLLTPPCSLLLASS